ncbi:c-type cytochrome [Vibrio fortis]|uniref:c-type cytochrome n=1 Tax=Vibrio fortis TaxID=212667 RepID=UPI003EB6F407
MKKLTNIPLNFFTPVYVSQFLNTDKPVPSANKMYSRVRLCLREVSLSALLLAVFAIGAPLTAKASLEVGDPIEARQQAFQSLEETSDEVSSMLRKSNPDWAQLNEASRALVTQSEILMVSFDKGSEGGKAKKDIWSKPEKFERLLLEMNEGYQELLQASLEQNISGAESGLDKANGTCRACHRSYRSRW